MRILDLFFKFRSISEQGILAFLVQSAAVCHYKLCEMTDADSGMNPRHFDSEPTNTGSIRKSVFTSRITFGRGNQNSRSTWCWRRQMLSECSVKVNVNVNANHQFIQRITAKASNALNTLICTIKIHILGNKLTSVVLESYFRFRFRPYHRNRHVMLHQLSKSHRNLPFAAE